MPDLSKIIVSTLKSFGVKINDFKETPEGATLYITVPEYSEFFNAQGKEMSGYNLAKRIQQIFDEMLDKPIKVRYKIRLGEFWTKVEGDAIIRASCGNLTKWESIYD